MSDMKIEQIRSLFNKTIENGASEAEAMQAIALAKKLMAKHGLTMDDIKQRKVNLGDYVWGSNDPVPTVKLGSFERTIAKKIADYTNTKAVVITKRKHNKEKYEREAKQLMFFGHKVDVELAIYILNIAKSALKIEWAKYVASSEEKIHGNRMKNFSIGMSASICNKINELMEAEKQNSSSTELIVVKNALVAKLYEEATASFSEKSTSVVKYNKDDSFEKGVEAGERVELHRKFEDKKVLKIGG